MLANHLLPPIPVLIEGRVESWMKSVLLEMQRTNRYISKHAIHKYGTEKDMSRPDWIMSYQGMVALVASQVWWTAEVEEVFRKLRNGERRAMIEYLTQQNRQIDDLVVKGKADAIANINR